MFEFSSSSEHSTETEALAADTSASTAVSGQASVEGLVEAATALRKKATSHFDKFEVKGRIAMRLLMAEVYAYFIVAVNAGNDAKVIAELKEKLSVDGKKIADTVSAASVLVRYIFCSFSSKQIHQYARSLEICAQNLVKPENFSEHVEKAGGFEMLCTQNLVSGQKSASVSSHAAALNMVKNAQPDHLVSVENWDVLDEARIYIGVMGDDGMLRLVDAKLSQDGVEQTLKRYRVESEKALTEQKKAREKVEELAKLQQAIVDKIEKQNEAQVSLLKIQQDLARAKKSGSTKQVKRLEDRVGKATTKLNEAEEKLSKAQSRLEQAQEAVS